MKIKVGLLVIFVIVSVSTLFGIRKFIVTKSDGTIDTANLENIVNDISQDIQIFDNEITLLALSTGTIIIPTISTGSISLFVEGNMFVSNTSTGMGVFIALGSTITITEARAYLITASSGTLNTIVDLTDIAGNNLLDSPLTFSTGQNWSDISQPSSTFATVPKDGHIVLRCTQIGDTTAGSNLMVYIRYWKNRGQ